MTTNGFRTLKVAPSSSHREKWCPQTRNEKLDISLLAHRLSLHNINCVRLYTACSIVGGDPALVQWIHTQLMRREFAETRVLSRESFWLLIRVSLSLSLSLSLSISLSLSLSLPISIFLATCILVLCWLS